MTVSFNQIVNYTSENGDSIEIDPEKIMNTAEAVITNELKNINFGSGENEIIIQFQFECQNMPGAKKRITVSPIKPDDDISIYIPLTRTNLSGKDPVANIREQIHLSLQIVIDRLKKKNITNNIQQLLDDSAQQGG